MSGVEVIAAVAGVTSAIVGATEFYRNWRDKKKKQRAEKQENKSLENSLVFTRSTVREEYDQSLARLGPRFEKRPAPELMSYVIQLQSTIISLMSKAQTSESVIIPELEIWLDTSAQARQRTVSTIASQYQSMLQEMPLTRSYPRIEASGSRIEKPSIGERPPDQPMSPVCSGELVHKPIKGLQSRWLCSACEYYVVWSMRKGSGMMKSLDEKIPVENVERNFYSPLVLLEWHRVRTKSEPSSVNFAYDACHRCKICANDTGKTSLKKILEHYQSHTSDEMRRAYGEGYFVCRCMAKISEQTDSHRPDCGLGRLMWETFKGNEGDVVTILNQSLERSRKSLSTSAT